MPRAEDCLSEVEFHPPLQRERSDSPRRDPATLADPPTPESHAELAIRDLRRIDPTDSVPLSDSHRADLGAADRRKCRPLPGARTRSAKRARSSSSERTRFASSSRRSNSSRPSWSCAYASHSAFTTHCRLAGVALLSPSGPAGPVPAFVIASKPHKCFVGVHDKVHLRPEERQPR